MDTCNATLSIDIIAPNSRCYDALRLSVGQLEGSNKYKMANARLADVLIFDFEESTEIAWNSYYRHNPGCLTIVLSPDPTCVPGLRRQNGDAKLIWLQKPVNREELINTLNWIHSGDYTPLLFSESDTSTLMAADVTTENEEDFQKTVIIKNYGEAPGDTGKQPNQAPEKVHFIREKWDDNPQQYAQICGTRDDIDLADAARITEIKLPINDLLLGHLLTLLKNIQYQEAPFSINIHDRFRLNLNPREQWAETDCPEQTIIEISRIAMDKSRLDFQEGSGELDNGQGQVTRMDIEQLLWKLSLWTYRGQLPDDVDLNQRVYLQHWPNLTRLRPIPNAMRIAALWSQQTLELGFTASALKIPQRHVFAFYSAANTIGLAGQAKRESDKMFDQQTLDRHTQHSLLQRVAFQIAKSASH